MQDNETLLAYLLQRGEETRALAVLRRPNISHELIYKFAPLCALYIELGIVAHSALFRSCTTRVAMQLRAIG